VAVPRDGILALAAALPSAGALFVDEAYADFEGTP